MFETSVDQPTAPAWLRQTVDLLKTRERLLLTLGVALQFAVLIGMIVMRLVPHLTGETVLLKVVPIDPRDLLRGDYVILGYDFSRFPPGGIPGLVGANTWDANSESQNKTVYVALKPEPDGLHYTAGDFSLTPPPSGKYIRGKIRGWGRLEFGIESYFVQEGKGHDYEDAIRSRRLWAEVVVSPDGEAALKGLRIE